MIKEAFKTFVYFAKAALLMFLPYTYFETKELRDYLLKTLQR